MSYLKNLRCSSCGRDFEIGHIQTFCPACTAPILAVYDLETARYHLDRELISRRPRGMWRWRELLPVIHRENQITLGEGDAPFLRLPRLGMQLGLPNLWVKDESQNPTGSFKARGLAAAVSKAKELGVQKLIIPTAGNAGGAMAAYASRAGMPACVVMPGDTPAANIEETRIMGAELILVDGLINDAARVAGEKAQSEGWFDLSTFKEPYRCEGKKVMGYELAEDFSWKLPDVILYPTGGGTGLIGMVKAFEELSGLGWLESNARPRMVVVQAEGCAPVVKAFTEGKEFCELWVGAETIAAGLRVPRSFADRIILRDLRDSCGTAVAVSDVAIRQAQRQMAQTEGVFCAPEGAATLAALNILVVEKWIQPEERVLMFNTGSGLKYLPMPE